ncbi:MAG: carbohydrate ABC transporter permease [Actinomycetota bacterium]
MTTITRAGGLKVRRKPPAAGARKEGIAGWAMFSPAALLLIFFVVVPFIGAIWFSFYNIRLDSVRDPSWMGLENYRRVLLDPDFRGDFYRSLMNNGIFAIVVVPVQTGLALFLAILLNRPLRGMSIFRTFFFMPVVFPMALVAVIWSLIYSRADTGLLNSLINIVSFGQAGPYDWLGSSSMAMLSIIIMSIWQGVGFQMVILLAGLQGISSSLYEAASIDGAGRWMQFRNVTLPGLRNTLIFVIMVTTILALRLFDQVYILTGDTTSTVMYQAVTTAFDENKVGLASSITVIFFVIVVGLTLIQRSVLREEREIQ